MPDADGVVVQGLSKTFRVGFFRRRVQAVREISFTVHSGEIFGLLGPNGAGKTTTIKMLMGLISPDTGSAELLGRPMGSRAGRELIGYLPENPALYEFLRGDEYLVYVGQLFGLSRREARARSDRLIEAVGLSGRADRLIRRFSKGMVQRLAIAQALVNDPRLIILDEPMSGLDPIGRKDVRDLIFRLRGEGRTIFFSTHILSDVEAICDRLAIISQGRVTDVGTLDQLLSPGVQSVELVVEGVDPELRDKVESIAGARSALRGDRLVFTAPSDQAADDALRALVAGNARVVALTRNRETLEDLFVRRARSERAAG